MDRHVPVSLLKPVVFRQVVEVVAADHDGALHLHLLHDSGEDAATDRHVAGERALLVNVCSFYRLVVVINENFMSIIGAGR